MHSHIPFTFPPLLTDNLFITIVIYPICSGIIVIVEYISLYDAMAEQDLLPVHRIG